MAPLFHPPFSFEMVQNSSSPIWLLSSDPDNRPVVNRPVDPMPGPDAPGAGAQQHQAPQPEAAEAAEAAVAEGVGGAAHAAPADHPFSDKIPVWSATPKPALPPVQDRPERDPSERYLPTTLQVPVGGTILQKLWRTCHNPVRPALPDSLRLCFNSCGNSLLLWTVGPPAPLVRIRLYPNVAYPGIAGPIHSLNSPIRSRKFDLTGVRNVRRVAGGDYAVAVLTQTDAGFGLVWFDPDGTRRDYTPQASDPANHAEAWPPTDMAVSPDDTTVAVAVGGCVRLFAVRHGDLVQVAHTRIAPTTKPTQSYLQRVRFSPTGDRLVATVCGSGCGSGLQCREVSAKLYHPTLYLTEDPGSVLMHESETMETTLTSSSDSGKYITGVFSLDDRTKSMVFTTNKAEEARTNQLDRSTTHPRSATTMSMSGALHAPRPSANVNPPVVPPSPSSSVIRPQPRSQPVRMETLIVRAAQSAHYPNRLVACTRNQLVELDGLHGLRKEILDLKDLPRLDAGDDRFVAFTGVMRHADRDVVYACWRGRDNSLPLKRVVLGVPDRTTSLDDLQEIYHATVADG